jgi:hypothetical protein
MSNLDKSKKTRLERLAKWLNNGIRFNHEIERYVEKLIIEERKQLQKKEPKTYTQEEIDKAIEQAWIKGQQSMLEF